MFRVWGDEDLCFRVMVFASPAALSITAAAWVMCVTVGVCLPRPPEKSRK